MFALQQLKQTGLENLNKNYTDITSLSTEYKNLIVFLLNNC